MGGKKGRNNKGATDDQGNSKDQQIAELTKQNKELNKKIDRLLELLAKEKEGGADGKGAASAAAQKKKEEAQKAAEAKKQKLKQKVLRINGRKILLYRWTKFAMHCVSNGHQQACQQSYLILLMESSLMRFLKIIL